MAGRGHRDIFAKDVAWNRGTGDGTQYARYLMDEDDTKSPLIIGANTIPLGKAKALAEAV